MEEIPRTSSIIPTMNSSPENTQSWMIDTATYASRPTRTMVVVCPAPQMAPASEDLAMPPLILWSLDFAAPGSLLTWVLMAATWSGSNACSRPMARPRPSARAGVRPSAPARMASMCGVGACAYKKIIKAGRSGCRSNHRGCRPANLRNMDFFFDSAIFSLTLSR